jgi:hypothetical protein
MAQRDYLMKQVQQEIDKGQLKPVWQEVDTRVFTIEHLSEDPDLVYTYHEPSAFTWGREFTKIYIAPPLWESLREMPQVQLVTTFLEFLGPKTGLWDSGLYTANVVKKNPAIIYSDRITSLLNDMSAVLNVISTTNIHGVSETDKVGLILRLHEIEEKYYDLNSEFNQCRVGLDLIKVSLSEEIKSAS